MTSAARASFPLLLLALLVLPAFPHSRVEGSPPTSQVAEPQDQPPQEETPPEEPFVFEPAPELGLPDEYFEGRGYLGNFPDAWSTDRLFDPANARVFLALQDGAGREALSKLDVPDLDLALGDLISGRLVRESGGIFRPAFPLIHGEAEARFSGAVQAAADRAYLALRPTLRKIRVAAEGEKVVPWLYALVWSEMLESRTSEKSLVEAGLLVPQRLRDEGYLWLLIPADSFGTGEDRYSSGIETLHYLWTPPSPINPAVQAYATRRRLLDAAVGNSAWTDEETRESLEGFGILDTQRHVRIPVLRKEDRLLKTLRKASRSYVREVLRALKPESLAPSLGVSRDEVAAAAFSCTGYRFLERAVRDGFLSRPDFLARADSPMTGLVEALVITENEGLDPLERSYYLYDGEDFQGSIRLADQFLQGHPGDSEALFRKGIALMMLRKYPEALRVFEQAVSRPAAKSDVWRGWLLIREGNILDMLQRRDEAVKKYSEALEYFDVSGSHDTARNWLENVYRD